MFRPPRGHPQGGNRKGKYQKMLQLLKYRNQPKAQYDNDTYNHGLKYKI